MGTGTSKELDFLVTTVKTDKGAQRITALKRLWDLADKNENKRLLASHQLGLLKELALVIKEDSGQARTNACGCVWYLSRDDKVSYTLTDPALRMIYSLLQTVREENTADNLPAKIAALSALGNISLLQDTHASMLAPDLELFKIMIRISREHELQPRQMTVKFLASMAKTATNATVNNMVTSGILTLVAHILKELGPDETKWADRSDGNCVGRWCIMLVMYLTRYRDAAKAMKGAGGGKIIEQYLSTSSQTLRCYTIIGMGFILGFGKSSRSLLREVNGATDEIVSVLRSTLENKSQIFSINLLSALCLSLAIVEGNKELLVKSALLELLIQILRRFKEMDPPVKGPKAANAKFPWDADHNPAAATDEELETFVFTIEVMVQLSGFFKNDLDLRVKYMSPELGISELLTELLDKSPMELAVPIKDKIRTLRNRLVPEAEDEAYAEKVASESVVEVFDQSAPVHSLSKPHQPQHIMISYSENYKKELVVDLHLSLIDLGYEVYRNETGSAFVGPMNTFNVQKRMPEAVDASHTIIVCVSPAYKDDVNCLMEAKYIMGRLHVSDLKLIFLMLDQKFTTISAHPIDGWLSFFVGTETGFPLWDRLMVITTTREIAKIMGESCKSSAAMSTQKVMSIEVEGRGPGTGVIDYAMAWSILTNPMKARYYKALVGIMQDMGVMQQSDLALCDEEQLLLLGLMLRQLHQASYLKAIGR